MVIGAGSIYRLWVHQLDTVIHGADAAAEFSMAVSETLCVDDLRANQQWVLHSSLLRALAASALYDVSGQNQEYS